MESVKKLVVKDTYSAYLVVVDEYKLVFRFEINNRFVPLENHYEEIKHFMAKNFPEENYIITFFDKNIRIS